MHYNGDVYRVPATTIKLRLSLLSQLVVKCSWQQLLHPVISFHRLVRNTYTHGTKILITDMFTVFNQNTHLAVAKWYIRHER